MGEDRGWGAARALVACAVAGAAGGAAIGCGDSACDKAVNELSALRVETIREASPEVLAPWKGMLDRARTTCASEKRESALERVAEIDHAITMRSADLSLAAGTRALAAASASAAPPPPPVWTIHCADVVAEGGFFGLLPTGVPRAAAPRLVRAEGAAPAEGAAEADAGVAEVADAAARDAGAPTAAGPKAGSGLVGPPDEALLLGGSPVYLSARGGTLVGAKLDGNAFVVQQSLPWPPEVAQEGAAAGRIVAARGPELLGVAWVADLRVFFAALDVATEKWSAFAELPMSGNDGGRDLVIGDMAWGRASFGLTLRTASGFTIIEVLPNARAVRPASLVPAYVAGTPRIAWGGDRFVVAAGRTDGEPSMGLWLAPDGAQAATWLPLVDQLPKGASIEPLAGELLAKDGSVHLAFRVATAGAPPKAHLGHAQGSVTALDTCP